MNKPSIDKIMSWRPCWSRDRVEEAWSRHETVEGILRDESIEVEDRIWFGLRPWLLGSCFLPAMCEITGRDLKTTLSSRSARMAAWAIANSAACASRDADAAWNFERQRQLQIIIRHIPVDK